MLSPVLAMRSKEKSQRTAADELGALTFPSFPSDFLLVFIADP